MTAGETLSNSKNSYRHKYNPNTEWERVLSKYLCAKTSNCKNTTVFEPPNYKYTSELTVYNLSKDRVSTINLGVTGRRYFYTAA